LEFIIKDEEKSIWDETIREKAILFETLPRIEISLFKPFSSNSILANPGEPLMFQSACNIQFHPLILSLLI